MNGNDNLLSEGLKHLAAMAPEEAPRRITANLQAAYHHHHVVRKRMRALQFMSLAASLLIAILIGVNWRTSPPRAGQSPSAGALPKPATPAVLLNVSPLPKNNVTPSSFRQRKAGLPSRVAGKFVLIPGADPSIAAGSLVVVRLELPASALGLVGLTNSGDISPDRVLADILVDQDGTPYAIRMANGAE